MMEASYIDNQDYQSQLADDSICSVLILIGIELDETIESDVDRNYRISLIITPSKSCTELLTNVFDREPQKNREFLAKRGVMLSSEEEDM